MLGGLELEGHTFHRLKPLLLLAYLALEGPKARRHLAQLFWPRAQDPLNSLSVALNQLKPTGAIEGNEILRARVSTDLEALRQALREGHLEEARRLYRGTFLEGVELPLGEELEEWVWSARERVALEVHGAFASQARAFYLLGLPERGKALLDEAQALPGVGLALEGAGEEFHPHAAPDLSSQLTYIPFASSTTVYVSVSAIFSPQAVLGLDSNNPASFSAITDIALVHATNQYTQSGTGSITLP